MEQYNPQPRAAGPALDARNLTVFIVEDDEAARHALVTSLEALGCNVLTYASCEEFLAAASDLEAGCLLLDYHFNGMNGLDLLARLKTAGLSIPTVLFSGRYSAFLRKRAIGDPAIVAVLDKPLDGRALFDALRRAQKLI